MLAKFHCRGRLNKRINATLLTLIPKVSNLVEPQDYKAIRLVGCVHKLLSLVLTNTLKCVLSSIINPFQGPLWGHK